VSQVSSFPLRDLLNLNKSIWKPSKNEGDVHLYSIPAFDAGKFELVDSSTIKSNKFIVPNKAILFSKLNPKFPRVWLIDEDNSTSVRVASSEFLVLIPKNKEDLYFLYFLLRSVNLRNQLVGYATGTSNSHQRFLPQDLLKIKVLVPNSISDRLSIGTKLHKIELLANYNTKLAEDLHRYMKNIFRLTIVDYPKNLKELNQFSGALPKELRLSKDSLVQIQSSSHELPNKWAIKKLTEIATYLNGLALQKYPPLLNSTDLKVIKIQQLQKMNTADADFASCKLKQEYIIENGDVLFSWSATLLIRVWTAGTGALNQHLFKVQGTSVPDWFAYFATERHMSWFRIIAGGKATTMGHIQRTHLSQCRIPVPDKDYLAYLDKFISPLWSYMIELSVANNRIKNLIDTTLSNFQSSDIFDIYSKSKAS
jgi:type I restriction enzyme S subunit